MIEAADLVVRRGGRILLDGVSVTIREGEVPAVVGPNGAGKTTLLRVISGEWRAEGGTVRMDGRDLSAYTAVDLARRRAVLRQDTVLPFPFTVSEVVGLGRLPHEAAASRQENERIVLEEMVRAEVDHLADRLYPTLSGGERQRTQLARAFAQIRGSAVEGGRYMLMDEPTASQDLAHQHRLLRLARGLAASGVGVLVVLHDLNLAARYADRLIVLKDGRKAAEGPPDEVMTPELVREVFSFEAEVHVSAGGVPYISPKVRGSEGPGVRRSEGPGVG